MRILLLIPVLLGAAMTDLHAAAAFTVELSTNTVRFLEPFQARYTIPGVESIAAAEIGSNDFAENSVELRILGTESNTVTVLARSLELSNASLPPLKLRVRKGGKESELVLPSYPLAVDILKANVTNAAPAAPIYYFHDWSWLILLAGAAAIAVLSVFFIRRIIGGKPRAAETIRETGADPWEEAKNALLAISALPVDAHNAKDQFAGISETVRRFLERGLGFPALELSTSEILSGYRCFTASRAWNETDSQDIREVLEHIIRSCDRVKYAKHIPSASERDTAVSKSLSLLDRTKTLLAPKQPEAGNGGAQ